MTKKDAQHLAPSLLQPMGSYVKGHGVLKVYWRSNMIFKIIVQRVLRIFHDSLYEARDTEVCYSYNNGTPNVSSISTYM